MAPPSAQRRSNRSKSPTLYCPGVRQRLVRSCSGALMRARRRGGWSGAGLGSERALAHPKDGPRLRPCGLEPNQERSSRADAITFGGDNFRANLTRFGATASAKLPERGILTCRTGTHVAGFRRFWSAIKARRRSVRIGVDYLRLTRARTKSWRIISARQKR
jgi:hypothetical protein